MKRSISELFEGFNRWSKETPLRRSVFRFFAVFFGWHLFCALLAVWIELDLWMLFPWNWDEVGRASVAMMGIVWGGAAVVIQRTGGS